MSARIESLLSARLFLAPSTDGNRIFFLSNLSGRLSLYVMRSGGSVPEPLLPPQLALQNPDLIDGTAFALFPSCGKILLCLDTDGDERYQAMVIPIEGGFPEPAGHRGFPDARVRILHCDQERNLAYLNVESLTEQHFDAYRLHVDTGELDHLGQSAWGAYVGAVDEERDLVVLADGYTSGDSVIYIPERGEPRRVLFGVPLEERTPGQDVPLNGIKALATVASGQGLLCITSVFTDSYGPAYLPLSDQAALQEVRVLGLAHSGVGELDGLQRLEGDRYLLSYNIDGCSWAYQCRFDEDQALLTVISVLCGQGVLAQGKLESITFEPAANRFALSFSTAVSPTQVYTIEGDGGAPLVHTAERVLGIPAALLSSGEDASFTSFDGLRVSARLYLPASSLPFEGPRPVVYYIHGGPQGQERPDFAWFSMPLIQFLTLNGFAVFVPNARGSTGYGLSYTKRVDHDWGGDDRIDHVHAMGVLADDPRLDTRRAAVVGRSYGGYMTLTLAARHPELWSAAVDMFGPYDLFKFIASLPETWQAYFRLAIGDPETDQQFLKERSPSTYIENIRCPLLVIQGKNDPRVVEAESRAIVESLRAAGKPVDYLLFENEGHDVLKFENRVSCYNAITQFFTEHLRP